jgi:CheW-like domain
VTLRTPPDDRPLADLLGVRDLFREEARAILDRLRRRLPELESQLPDASGLGDVVADGVALKGSGALVGLAVVSRAGTFVVRAAELAAERAPDDLAGAMAVVASLRASLGALERLLDVCLDGGDAAQDALLAEALDRFAPGDRSILRSAIDAPDVARLTAPDGPTGGRVVAEAAAGLVTALTDLLIADTQLGGVERELDVLAAALERGDASDAPVVRRVADALAARAAPARALTRAASELHRWVRTLNPVATPLEPLVLLHAGDCCYGIAADDVESVVVVPDVLRLDEAGRATLPLEGDPLTALDVGRYLGAAACATPVVAAIVRARGVRFALLVARAESPRLMVLRPLDALLSHHPLSRAATIGGRGEIVLVLRTTALLDALEGRADAPGDFR